MRRIMSALIATWMLGSTVLAQGPVAYVLPSVPAPRDPPPHFTIAPRGASPFHRGPGRPVDLVRGTLAPIGLPLPPIGLPSRQNVFFSWPTMVFYVEQPVAPAPLPEPAPSSVEPPPTGRLILEVEPETAQIFADGYYIGVPADFSGARGGGLLEAGPHRIDVSAPGYEPITVDLRVTTGQPVTYRGALKALPPPALAPPTTFYLIPGCYMGNIPPKSAQLSKGCDESRAITWRP